MIESIFFNPWIWIVPIIMFIFVLLIVADIVFDWAGIVAIVGTFFFLILGGFYFSALLPPYDGSFYQTYRITGELTEVEAAFNGDNGSMSQVFIAKVDGIDLFIKSDDQRFRTVNVGDDVNLVCDKHFAYFQEPWYDCSFGSAK